MVSPSPSATVQFDWDPPLKEFHFQLSRFGEGISDFTPLWAETGGLFKQDMAAQFATEGETSGDEWAPLSDAYAAWKAKHYPGRTIGWLTGALMQSMTGGAGYIELFTPLTAEFGQADGATPTEDGSYGRFFNDGTDKMPARPLLRFSLAWGVAFQNAAANWVRLEAHHSGLIGVGSKTYNQPLSAWTCPTTHPCRPTDGFQRTARTADRHHHGAGTGARSHPGQASG